MTEIGKLYVGFDSSGLFKIGITNDEKKRLKQFRTGNTCFMFLFVFTVENPAIEEITLHTKFNNCRVDGEWFNLSPEHLKFIYDRYMPIENRRHGLDSFKTVWDIIVDKKSAGSLDFRKYISAYMAVSNG